MRKQKRGGTVDLYFLFCAILSVTMTQYKLQIKQYLSFVLASLGDIQRNAFEEQDCPGQDRWNLPPTGQMKQFSSGKGKKQQKHSSSHLCLLLLKCVL